MIQIVRNRYIGLFIAGLACLSVSFASAHGTGATYEVQKDGYFVDVGYSAPAPIAGESLRFDFNAHVADSDVSSDEEVFTDVWVRIAQDRDLFFSGGIHQPVFGVTGFTYIFPKEGTYEVLARFQNEGETVVEVSFPLEVAPSPEDSGTINPFLAAGVGFLLGGVILFFIGRRKI